GAEARRRRPSLRGLRRPRLLLVITSPTFVHVRARSYGLLADVRDTVFKVGSAASLVSINGGRHPAIKAGNQPR
ncbi:MAG: hypothetical protein ACREP9_16620, partial [Candidatus Dormibacteraceae bacterium]